MSKHIDEFEIISLNTQLLHKHKDLIGISIIQDLNKEVNLDFPNVLIVKLNMRGMIMFFEYDLKDDLPLFTQCDKNILETFNRCGFYPPKAPPFKGSTEKQIIHNILYNTKKSIDWIDFDIINALALEATLNNNYVDETQEYIANKFSKGGEWFPLLEGKQEIKIKSSFH